MAGNCGASTWCVGVEAANDRLSGLGVAELVTLCLSPFLILLCLWLNTGATLLCKFKSSHLLQFNPINPHWQWRSSQYHRQPTTIPPDYLTSAKHDGHCHLVLHISKNSSGTISLTVHVASRMAKARTNSPSQQTCHDCDKSCIQLNITNVPNNTVHRFQNRNLEQSNIINVQLQ